MDRRPNILSEASAPAVASSPLFKLSPAIRNMVYHYVLVGSDSNASITVPRGCFKTSKTRPLYPCPDCHKVFHSDSTLRRHYSVRDKHGGAVACKSPSKRTPTISISLLRVCRIVHTECAAIFYRANVFCFNCPQTAHGFRRKTANDLSQRAEEIAIEISEEKVLQPWLNYICGSRRGWRMADDFPHIRRIVIELKDEALLFESPKLASLCKAFGDSAIGLDWVHVIGLNDETMISLFEPMIESSPVGEQGLTIQKYITEYECFSGWKNVTIWRGTSDSRPPFLPKNTAGTRGGWTQFLKVDSSENPSTKACL